MNKLKQLYRDYFGLTEETATKSSMFTVLDKDVENMEKMAQAAIQVKKALGEEQVDEASLDNHITEYQGGVEMVMIDPALAKQTMLDILQWTKKKGFTVVIKKLSRSGKSSYIYFRLGENPGKEAQRIQGYISQLPNIKHFRFKVRNQPEQPVV